MSNLRVSIHALFDCHLFTPIIGSTPLEVMENCILMNKEKIPVQRADGSIIEDIGPASLCPAVVLNGNKEVRRVGQMIHPNELREFDDSDIINYLDALTLDKDIMRLLLMQSGQLEGENNVQQKKKL